MSPHEEYPQVLHLIASLAIGGTERQLVGFIQRSSVPARHHIALFDEPGALASEVPNQPHVIGRVARDLRGLSSTVAAVRGLHALIIDLGVDLVHAHLDLSQLLAALATPRNVPIVASRRGRNVGIMARPWLRPLEGLAHRRTAVLVCNSEYLARQTRARDLWPPKTEVIHNAVDTDRFAPQPMPRGGATVALVANAHVYKRLDRFLEGFRVVRETLPEARATVVGGGPRLPDIEGLARRLDIADAVTFAGQVEDVRPFLARARVVALTSDHEGTPNVLLEAMATGRPVVSTAVGGVSELVRDGVDGLLVPRDAVAVGEALLRLLGDHQLARRMGTSARERAMSFGWDRVVVETEALYRRVVAARGV